MGAASFPACPAIAQSTNTIPTDFIERVELLTGGASATYGSDAVAGVINIILKKNFNGVLLDAQTGRSDQHDDFKKNSRSLSALPAAMAPAI
jgi:outer membrane receptor protein involved in Fe transport